MTWLYPKVKHLPRVLLYVFLSGFLGGLYGALHDQVSYTISPEYFTQFKFYQFSFLNFGFSERVFVACIGFLAVSSVGMIVGWFLSRIRLYSDDLYTARRDIWQGFGTVLLFALLFLGVGACWGWFRYCYLLSPSFFGWEHSFGGELFRRFAVVGTMHHFGYAGGLFGLIVAIVVMKYKMRSG